MSIHGWDNLHSALDVVRVYALSSERGQRQTQGPMKSGGMAVNHTLGALLTRSYRPDSIEYSCLVLFAVQPNQWTERALFWGTSLAGHLPVNNGSVGWLASQFAFLYLTSHDGGQPLISAFVVVLHLKCIPIV